MPDVGVRELKTHTSAIIRQVREEGTPYVITYRGRPVGLLAPLERTPASPELDQEAGEAAWETLCRLGEEIGRGWRLPQAGGDLLSEMRR